MTLRVSAAFATTLDTPDHVAVAESLGYERAWLYDTPQQSPDVWMCLALAAQQTTSSASSNGWPPPFTSEVSLPPEAPKVEMSSEWLRL